MNCRAIKLNKMIVLALYIHNKFPIRLTYPTHNLLENQREIYVNKLFTLSILRE